MATLKLALKGHFSDRIAFSQLQIYYCIITYFIILLIL